jgi:hypothetical protein
MMPAIRRNAQPIAT